VARARRGRSPSCRCDATIGVAGVPGRDGLQVGGPGGAGRDNVGPAGGVLGLLALLAFPHVDDDEDDEEEKGGEITVKWFDLYFRISDSRRVLEAEKMERSGKSGGHLRRVKAPQKHRLNSGVFDGHRLH
jgi:hypothetical protein